MLELLYIGRFDYLAHPNAPDRNEVPDDLAVAVAVAAADETASRAKDVSGPGAGLDDTPGPFATTMQ
jgi:hypothetical protein